MDLEGYMPGNRVVVLGSGDVGLIVARRLAMEGAKVEAVVEALPYPGGSDRNVVQCLEDFNIPLLLKHTITLIHGNERVEGVTVAEVNERGKPLPNTEKKIGCDTLVISAGLIPENELSKGAGIALDPATKGPIIDERAETLVPGMFACGNVVHVHDLVDHVSRGGELAGTGAASYIAGKLLPARKRMRLLPGDNTRYVVPQVISGELPVDLHLRASRPMRGVAVKIGGLSFPRRAVKPSELIVIPLTPTELRRAGIRDGLRVSIEAEG
jgi:pyruvate/2-oxoglutarate dehydrogenase complex dihydrolipoamide dehydrogenase (E3) component